MRGEKQKRSACASQRTEYFGFVTEFGVLVNEKRQKCVKRLEIVQRSCDVASAKASPNGMLGFLLITWENGRALKTYGLNCLEHCNMKITFLCIVIVVSCSVCASGDVEIYPGLKLELSREELRRRLETAENSVPSSVLYHYNKKWPWDVQRDNNDDLEDDYGLRQKTSTYALGLADRLRTLEEYLAKEKHRRDRLVKTDDELPIIYNNLRPNSFDEVDGDEEYRYLEKARKINDHFGDFRINYPHSPILDDVRPYPQEDDFTFGDDDGDADENDEEAPEMEPEKIGAVRAREAENRGHKHEMPPPLEQTTEDDVPAGSKPFANAKFVEDPTLFAYSPTDVRFFQSTSPPAYVSVPVKQQEAPEKSDKNKDEHEEDNSIRLAQRSEESRIEKTKHYPVTNQDGVKVVSVRPAVPSSDTATVYIIAIVAGISAAATVGLIAVGIGWYNLQKHVKNASDVEYPAYGVTGPNKDASPSGDRRLAQSAQMYHYQHQKQQIIAMESRAAAGDRHGSVSEADSEEENEEGDYTVYECPGLAPTGEMEVKNPLFHDDPTPAQTPQVVQVVNKPPNADDKK